MILILVAFMLTQPFAAAAESQEKTSDWYRDNGVTVVAPLGSAPMSFVGVSGQPEGFVIDLWKKWSAEMGIPVHFRLAPWKDTLHLVQTGAGEIHGGLFFNTERDAFLDFSESYLQVPAALIVSKDKDADQDTVFTEYTIGVVDKGFAELFILKKYPNAKLKRYSSGRDILQGYVDGEIQAMAGDSPILQYELGRLGLTEKLVVKETLYTQGMHGATAKGAADIVELMNDGFALIDKEERKLIVKRWFVVNEDDSFTRNIILIAISFVVGVVGLFYFDGLTLRRKATE